MLKYLLLILLLALALLTPKLCLVIAATAVFLIAVFVPFELYSNRRQTRRAVNKAGGRIVFVYTSRRGWNELVVNNILPLLEDEGILPLNRTGGRDGNDEVLLQVIRAECTRRYGWGSGPPAPFFASLQGYHRRAWIFTPLHGELLPYKYQRRRSRDTQQFIQPIIDSALQTHRASIRDRWRGTPAQVSL